MNTRTVEAIWADITRSQSRVDDLTRKVESGKPGYEGNCKALHDACYERVGLEEELAAAKQAMGNRKGG